MNQEIRVEALTTIVNIVSEGNDQHRQIVVQKIANILDCLNKFKDKKSLEAVLEILDICVDFDEMMGSLDDTKKRWTRDHIEWYNSKEVLEANQQHEDNDISRRCADLVKKIDREDTGLYIDLGRGGLSSNTPFNF